MKPAEALAAMNASFAAMNLTQCQKAAAFLQVRSGRNFTLAMARGLAELQIHFETIFRLSLRRQGRNVGFNQGQVARDDDHEHRPEKE